MAGYYQQGYGNQYGGQPSQQGYGSAPGYPSQPQMGYPPAGGGYPGGYGGPQGPPPGADPTLWNWFITVDRDRSGQITADELQQALLNGNWSQFNCETCRLMIGIFDRDQSGTIDFREFQQLWLYITQWKGAFDRYDQDRSGAIEGHELHRAFAEMGFNVSANFVGLVLKRFDRLARRSLRLDSFIQCCVMLRALTDAFRMRDTNQNGNITINYEDFMCMVLLNKP
ncbi:programmed cell death protein 6-like [Acropora muricata]|uniref:programmed cell death protein 6-like n=1 Tax=Acropora millepora TaxID=45264 RepID=UPI0010FCC190|nr:programmed cell death protein 6-like [Acropora millepora]